MKICFVLPHFYPYVGGGERIFYDMVKGLLKKGHEIRVLARNVGDEYLGHKTVEGMEVYYFPWKSMFGHPLVKARDIEEHIKWCDVVHASVFTPAHPASRLARKYHKPSVLTIHEVRGNKWFWVEDLIHACGFWLYEQYTCRAKYDVYHTVSQASKRDYLRFCGQKNVQVVYNSVTEMDTSVAETSKLNLREYFNLGEEERIFLYYGRPGQTKGINIYLHAIRRLRERGVDLSDIRFCFILGAEPVKLRARFLRNIEANGLGDVMLVRDSLGRADLCRCILQADYVVVPSVTEGFGLSALEACQMGKKIISSTGGALTEVVYGDCLFFENRDDAMLADRLQSVIEQGDIAFEHIPPRSFPYNEMVDGIENIYKSIYNDD
ncbi:MAG: glycosyltransferase family 4 protein [Lachnospiraceae bacterium]|nr:glycosyltransferase family 4 protein [Lachnospiraceae bacterium]